MAAIQFDHSTRLGPNQVVFHIALSEALPENVFLTYNTIDGSGRANKDYISAYHEWIEILAGSCTGKIVIDIVNPEFFNQQKSFYIEVLAAELSESGAAVAVSDPIGGFGCR